MAFLAEEKGRYVVVSSIELEHCLIILFWGNFRGRVWLKGFFRADWPYFGVNLGN